MLDKPRRIVKWILGVLLIIVGVSGLFLPFLPGIVFLSFGIMLISPKTMKRIKEHIQKKKMEYASRFKEKEKLTVKS